MFSLSAVPIAGRQMLHLSSPTFPLRIVRRRDVIALWAALIRHSNLFNLANAGAAQLMTKAMDAVWRPSARAWPVTSSPSDEYLERGVLTGCFSKAARSYFGFVRPEEKCFHISQDALKCRKELEKGSEKWLARLFLTKKKNSFWPLCRRWGGVSSWEKLHCLHNHTAGL